MASPIINLTTQSGLRGARGAVSALLCGTHHVAWTPFPLEECTERLQSDTHWFFFTTSGFVGSVEPKSFRVSLKSKGVWNDSMLVTADGRLFSEDGVTLVEIEILLHMSSFVTLWMVLPVVLAIGVVGIGMLLAVNVATGVGVASLLMTTPTAIGLWLLQLRITWHQFQYHEAATLGRLSALLGIEPRRLPSS